MRARIFRIHSATLLVSALAIEGCGARSELPDIPPDPPLPECLVDADCPGFDDLCRDIHCVLEEGGGGAGGGTGGALSGGGGASDGVRKVCREVAPVDCDDGDLCTIDACVPESGACEYAPASLDLDGDGFNGPREGAKAGDPDSCGDDCDDTSPAAFPGNLEVCDGVDNDCNEVVDDNASFTPVDGSLVRISPDGFAPAGPGGLAFGGENYVALWTGFPSGGFNAYRVALSPSGDKLAPDAVLTDVAADSSGGPIVWTGDRFGVLWQDRGFADYEIFFRLLDANGGTVVTPPVRLSNGFGFSVNPDLAWTGSRFVAVWQDEREGDFGIFGALLGVDGTIDVPERAIVPYDGLPYEAPAVAASSQGIGLAFGRTGSPAILFQSFDFELNSASPLVPITDGTTQDIYPTIAFNDGNYVIAWYRKPWPGDDTLGAPFAIYAAVVSPAGAVLVPPTAISAPGLGQFSRNPAIKALGDRILFVYSDTRGASDGQFELYARLVDATLSPITPEQRITNAPGVSVSPKLAFGPEGDVGILLRDDREGPQHVWFTRLGCAASTLP
jgi:hypothetical protein